MLSEPTIGSKVTITNDWSDLYASYPPSFPRTTTVSGVKVPSLRFDHPDTWRIATGNPDHPESVVEAKRAINVVYHSGNADIGPKQSADDKAWRVKGSKSPYIVRRVSGKYMCECKGFGYRGTCTHITKVTEFMKRKPQ